MNLIESLNWRYACKKFDTNKKLTQTQVNDLVEVLRLSASSYGLQPWRFVVVENPAKREELVAHSYNQRQVAEASHLFVLCAPKEFNENHVDAYLNDIVATRGGAVQELEGYKKMMMGTLSRLGEKQTDWMKNQIYIALGSLLTGAAVLGIDTCPMEGFVASKYDEILGLNDLGLKSVVVCPVGFRAEDDKYSSLKKVRFNKNTLVHTI